MIFEKYKKIYLLGHEENAEIFSNSEDEIIVEEKMGGGNFRFYVSENGVVIFGSRSQELDLSAEHTKNFWICSEFVKKRIYSYDLSKYKHFIFYGECMIKHTLDYDWENIPRFLGYDILNADTGKFLPFEQVQLIFDEIDLPIVPLVKICKAKDVGKIDDEAVPISVYVSPSAKDRQAEGVVFKNYDKQIFAKYVRDKFKEANAEAFGGSPKYNKVDDTNNSEFIFRYVTNARIDKMIFKLIDEGEKLDLRMMSKLPKRIYEDVWEEQWKEIRGENWKLDLKKLRQLIPKRCLAVLKQVIVNNAFKPS